MEHVPEVNLGGADAVFAAALSVCHRDFGPSQLAAAQTPAFPAVGLTQIA